MLQILAVFVGSHMSARAAFNGGLRIETNGSGHGSPGLIIRAQGSVACRPGPITVTMMGNE